MVTYIPCCIDQSAVINQARFPSEVFIYLMLGLNPSRCTCSAGVLPLSIAACLWPWSCLLCLLWTILKGRFDQERKEVEIRRCPGCRLTSKWPSNRRTTVPSTHREQKEVRSTPPWKHPILWELSEWRMKKEEPFHH